VKCCYSESVVNISQCVVLGCGAVFQSLPHCDYLLQNTFLKGFLKVDYYLVY